MRLTEFDKKELQHLLISAGVGENLKGTINAIDNQCRAELKIMKRSGKLHNRMMKVRRRRKTFLALIALFNVQCKESQKAGGLLAYRFRLDYVYTEYIFQLKLFAEDFLALE